MNKSFTPIQHPFPEPPNEGEVVKVAPGILWVRLPLPMKLDHVNIYVLEDDDGWTIVDTGFASARGRKIWQKLLDGPLKKHPVKRVIVTHHHPDHIGLAGWFQTEFGAELVTTRTTWLFARMLCLDSHDTPKEESINFWRRAGMDAKILESRMSERPFNFSDVLASMPLGFSRIKQDDVIKIGARRWQVHIGNGHAPEHATLWSLDDNLILAGDQILSSISPNIGVYATEPDADPLADWLEACERFLKIARQDHFVLPGHKLPFTGLSTRLTQLIDNHHSGLKRLLEFLNEPHSAAECFAVLYKRKIGDGEYGLALVEAVAHLNHLYNLNLVTRKLRADGAFEWLSKGSVYE